MPLDIHQLEKGAIPGKLIFQIGDASFKLMAPVFSLLHQQVGLNIDQYDDLILWGDFSQLIHHLERMMTKSSNQMLKSTNWCKL
ncbi:MAG: hypothetical protein WBP13_12540 [Methylophilaceae bacterium]